MIFSIASWPYCSISPSRSASCCNTSTASAISYSPIAHRYARVGTSDETVEQIDAPPDDGKRYAHRAASRISPSSSALFTALAIARRPLTHRAGVRMFATVAIFGLATIVFGLSKNFYLSLGSLVVLGAADMVSVYIRHALVQFGTPDAMRGRVSAVSVLFIGASNELGEFESGVTAALFGTVPAVVIGGIGTLLVVAIGMRLFPQLRKVDRLADAANS